MTQPLPACPGCSLHTLEMNPTPARAAGPKLECPACGWYTIGEYGADADDPVTYLFEPEVFRPIRKRGEQRRDADRIV